MYLLKLFHQSEPDLPIAAHIASEGRTRVGRDPAAEWVVPDPDREVSRTHFELTCAEGELYVTPIGTNGVFIDQDRQLDQGEPQRLCPGDTIFFGKFRMIVEAPARERWDPSDDRTSLAAPFGLRPEVPSAWPDARPAPAPASGDVLLDAFCRGADLDVSAFSNEDAEAVLTRAGEIYRQMVLGLADLLGARTAFKQDHELERTTISAKDNNPFKWAPSRRLASDLLLRNDAGFLTGPDAARASFSDVKSHMLATLAGHRAVVDLVLNSVQPAEIETRVKASKSMLQSQGAACWSEFVRAQGELFATGSDGPLARAFATAYEARVRDLEREAEERAAVSGACKGDGLT